ncbi:DUF4411 family protein [bacterium]|nr:DUF4411 family protein [bacterium]
MIYVFDTSSISVLKDYYFDTFKSFWDLFNADIQNGNVVSVREVYNELDARFNNDERYAWLWNWIKQNRRIFSIPDAEQTAFISEIFKNQHFQTLIGKKQQLIGKPVADPFVIAYAKVLEGCVVTEEIEKPNASKIPNVCRHFGVECVNLEGYLLRKGWSF